MKAHLSKLRKSGAPKAKAEAEAEDELMVPEGHEESETPAEEAVEELALAPDGEVHAGEETPEEEQAELEALPDDVILEEAKRRGLV